MPVTPESAPGMVKALPNAGIRNGNSVVDGPCLRRRSRDAPSRSHGRCCCLSRAGSAPPTDFQPAGYPRKRNDRRHGSAGQSDGRRGARRGSSRPTAMTASRDSAIGGVNARSRPPKVEVLFREYETDPYWFRR